MFRVFSGSKTNPDAAAEAALAKYEEWRKDVGSKFEILGFSTAASAYREERDANLVGGTTWPVHTYLLTVQCKD